MRRTPLLAGAATACWAWSSGHVMAGALSACALEALLLVRARWDLDRREFERVADLAGIAATLLLVWQWIAAPNAGEGIIAALIWAPVFLAPILALQRIAIAQRVPLTAFFWSLRRRAAVSGAVGQTDVEPAYVWVCLVAAACANPRGNAFLAALAALAALLLWRQRPARAGIMRWGAVVVIALGLAAALQAGMVRLQAWVEASVLEAFQDRQDDRWRSHTSIGALGELKLSGRIVVRLPGPQPAPPLLRDGAYDTFAHDMWFIRRPGHRAVRLDGDANWTVTPGVAGPVRRMVVRRDRGHGALPLPDSVVRLEGLEAESVDVDALGTVRVVGPELMAFAVRATSAPVGEGVPAVDDLAVPERLGPVLDAVIGEAGLPRHDAAAAARAVIAHFAAHYRYTTHLQTPEGKRRPMEAFLGTDRRGHCEYFASAATLLLRRLGVPARYATGFAVHEWSVREQAWVVRARDAHAWTRAWIDGAWRDVDATPSGWVDAESAAASRWESVADVASWLGVRFSLWRRSRDDAELFTHPAWLALILPLGAWLAWSVLRRSRRQDPLPTAAVESTGIAPPEVARLVAALAGVGHVRPASMSVSAWLVVLPWSEAGARDAAARLAADYRRWRYDPLPGGEALERRLRADADVLLARLPGEVAASG